MIYWQDFILDDVCGPLLVEELIGDTQIKVSRRKRIDHADIKEDVMGVPQVQIQETGQELQPARTVGCSPLDSFSPTSKEAGQSDRFPLLRQVGEA